MIGVVIVSHGRLADEFIRATKFIVGEVEQLEGVNVESSQSVDEIRKMIEKAIKTVDSGQGVLILTDMFGGTPSNISLSFLKEGKVEVLSGVNIPMMLKLATSREGKTLNELAIFIKLYGQKNISLAGELLSKKVK